LVDLWRATKSKSPNTPTRITRPAMRWSMGANFFTFVAATAVAANIAPEKTCTCMFVRGARAKVAALLPAVVVTITVKPAGLPLFTCTAAGTTQVAACGAPAQLRATLPENPAPGVRAKAYWAVTPALMVVDVGPLVVTANGLAVPLRETDCGEATLFEIVNCAVRRPAATGVKVTPMGQLAPVAMGAVHPLLNEKSAKFAPDSATLEMLSVAVPVPAFITIKFCIGDAVPARIVENVNVPADKAIEVVPFEPVPLSDTIWGLPLALSAIESVACRSPIAVGVKVKLMEQKASLASETGQVLLW
jgi:hypothetical protein